MATYHIIEEGWPYTKPLAYSYSLENAKKYLAELRAKTGKGYYIVKVLTVYEIEPMTDEERHHDEIFHTETPEHHISVGG